MTTITLTGTHKNADGSFPDGKAITATLISKKMFSGGAYINQFAVTAAIDDDDGSFSLTLHVPDDAEQAARYHFSLPDSTTFYAAVSQDSATDWETFVGTATSTETYSVDALDLYMPKAGGAFTGAITLSGAPSTDLHAATKLYADGKIPRDATILSKSAIYTVLAADAGKIIECDGTFTVTLPDSLATGFQVVIVNVGSGTITVAASTTLQTKDSNADLANQYGAATAYHRGSNVWCAFGDLS